MILRPEDPGFEPVEVFEPADAARPRDAGPESGFLLVSPHSDDIAYSLGGSMRSRWWRARTDRTILTVFSRSQHAPYLAADPESAAGEAEITRVRRAEDRAYAASLGARWVAAPFGEAMTRGYPDIASLYAVEEPEDDPLYARLERELVPWLLGGTHRFVMVPVGIGGHIEHRIAARLALRASATASAVGGREIHVVFYEDQPYASDFDDAALERILDREIGPARRGLLTPIGESFDAKIEDLRGYRSQFRLEDAAPLRLYAAQRTPAREQVTVLGGGVAGRGGERDETWPPRPLELLWGSGIAVEALRRALEG